LFEGKKVNLRVMEKEDLPLLSERDNNPEVARAGRNKHALAGTIQELGVGLDFNSRT
jgi:hypothetical protein